MWTLASLSVFWSASQNGGIMESQIVSSLGNSDYVKNYSRPASTRDFLSKCVRSSMIAEWTLLRAKTRGIIWDAIDGAEVKGGWIIIRGMHATEWICTRVVQALIRKALTQSASAALWTRRKEPYVDSPLLLSNGAGVFLNSSARLQKEEWINSREQYWKLDEVKQRIGAGIQVVLK